MKKLIYIAAFLIPVLVQAQVLVIKPLGGGSGGSGGTVDTTAGVINIATQGFVSRGYYPVSNPSSYINLAGARTAFTLTNTGSSGTASYNNSTGAWNIPNYTLTGLGGQPSGNYLTSFNGRSTLAAMPASGDYTQDQITDGSTNRSYTNTEKTKLAGIATGATNVTNTNQLTNGAGFLTNLTGANGTPSAITLTNGTGLPESGVVNLTTDLSAKVSSATISWPGAIYASPTTGTVTSGALNFAPALSTQSANNVFAGPSSGAAATPGFRVLAAADIPAIPESGVTNLPADLAAAKQNIDSFSTQASYATLWRLLHEIDSVKKTVSRIILVNNTQLSNTGNTTENTVFTGTIPANSIGVNGSYDINTLFSWTNSAGTKTFKVKINGTVVQTLTTTTSFSQRNFTKINNRNSLSSQVSLNGTAPANNGFAAATSNAIAPYSFNTATDLTLTITCQSVTVGTDTETVESVEVIANP